MNREGVPSVVESIAECREQIGFALDALRQARSRIRELKEDAGDLPMVKKAARRAAEKTAAEHYEAMEDADDYLERIEADLDHLRDDLARDKIELYEMQDFEAWNRALYYDGPDRLEEKD